ncbi:MAG: AAA family ATPase [Clostridia bacterium]|nr:AAA family ATPase [Clostridia bacterium]
MEYGLIGAKLGHSYSVPIHARLGDYDYRLYERGEEDFIRLLQSRDFKGLNVTIPYKRLAFELCDALSDTARQVGCVNTLIVRPDGSLYGHNTDIGGFIAMARRAGVAIRDRKAVILGSGGTSLTARAACGRLGARQIVVVSRQGPVDYEALYRDHADAEVLINTTPVGMYPENGKSPAELSRLPRLTGVLDVIYNPDRTALILDALDRGLPCCGGLYMLVGQAREAAELFTGREIDPGVTDRIYRQLRGQALNLILIGMPGCGKSAVGRALAADMGREFIDCDAEIVRRAGKSIPEIFAEQGEAGFRALEAELVAEVCKGKGAVIATGGGAVLRPQNVRAMRQNGRLIWLTRPLEALSTAGRPLSKSPEALREMWKAREPVYRAAADARVDNDGGLQAAVQRAKEAYHEAVDR